MATLNNIRLWDPSNNISLQSVTRRQSIRSYYSFTNLSVDRYYINGKLTPVLIGARQLESNNLPSNSWVNQHLQYTHGIGAAVVAANQVDPRPATPIFVVSNVPPQSTNGMPNLTQPDIYFGLGLNGWVVANTKQPELDYEVNSGPKAGTPVDTHYASTGGVPVGGFFSRFALALRLGDFNFLISNQITSKSRVMFVRDVRQMAQKARPFLTFDSQPYAVIANGEVQYVLDGYTSTTQYPYSENASNLNINTGDCPSSFNYARNAVKVVVNAYTGSMKFYVDDPNDPIIKAYRSAFPLDVPAHERDALDDPHPLALPPRPLLRAGRHLRALPHHLCERLLLGVGPLGDLSDDGRGIAVDTLDQTTKDNAAGEVLGVEHSR